MIVSLIVACSQDGYIGKDGKLPWHLPEDLKNFKKITLGFNVIMGRKTFESIGKPLNGRDNYVVTRGSLPESYSTFDKEKGFTSEIWINSVEDGLFASARATASEVFIIGGGQIYQEVLDKNLVDRVYLTLVPQNVEGDTKFPLEHVLTNFEKVQERPGSGATYYVLERKSV